MFIANVLNNTKQVLIVMPTIVITLLIGSIILHIIFNFLYVIPLNQGTTRLHRRESAYSRYEL
jgi:hypothetical protein